MTNDESVNKPQNELLISVEPLIESLFKNGADDKTFFASLATSNYLAKTSTDGILARDMTLPRFSFANQTITPSTMLERTGNQDQRSE